MYKLKEYSPFFETIADERRPNPLHNLGRGHHFSVLQTKKTDHRFIIVWDEDHDERIIEAIEDMLLYPQKYPFNFAEVIAFSERKANMFVVTSLQDQEHEVRSEEGYIQLDEGDCWTLSVNDIQGMCNGEGMPGMLSHVAQTFGIVKSYSHDEEQLNRLLGAGHECYLNSYSCGKTKSRFEARFRPIDEKEPETPLEEE